MSNILKTATVEGIKYDLGYTPIANDEKRGGIRLTSTQPFYTTGTDIDNMDCLTIRTGENISISNNAELFVNTATTTIPGAVAIDNIRNTVVNTTHGDYEQNNYYGVEIDSNGKAFVNVPWVSDPKINDVTSEKSGLMTPTDKAKLDGLENYVLPTASIEEKGGIKIMSDQPLYITGTDADSLAIRLGNNIGIDNDSKAMFVKNATTTIPGAIKLAWTRDKEINIISGGLVEDRNYGVEVDSTGKAFVNVPWIDTQAEVSISPAKPDTYGLVKVAGVRNTAITTVQGTEQPDRNYGVELDSEGKAFVNVPWTSTQSGTAEITYSTGTGLTMDGTTFKANLKSEIAAENDSNNVSNTSNRQYAVVSDKSGFLSVNVPWTDTVSEINIEEIQSLNTVEANDDAIIDLKYNEITTCYSPIVYINLPGSTSATKSWHSEVLLKNPDTVYLGTSVWSQSKIDESVFWSEPLNLPETYETDTYYKLRFNTYELTSINNDTLGKFFIDWSRYTK